MVVISLFAPEFEHSLNTTHRYPITRSDS